MAIFNAGALPALVIMVVTFCCLLFFMITKGRKGKEMKLRKLPAISAIEEAVGAATERGRPVHYTTDTIGLAHADGAQCYAGLSIMAYTADLAAQRASCQQRRFQSSMIFLLRLIQKPEGLRDIGEITLSGSFPVILSLLQLVLRVL